jgi:hypothetical protein
VGSEKGGTKKERLGLSFCDPFGIQKLKYREIILR